MYEFFTGNFITAGQALGLILIVTLIHLIASAIIRDEKLFRVEYADGREMEFHARTGRHYTSK